MKGMWELLLSLFWMILLVTGEREGGAHETGNGDADKSNIIARIMREFAANGARCREGKFDFYFTVMFCLKYFRCTNYITDYFDHDINHHNQPVNGGLPMFSMKVGRSGDLTDHE